VPTRLGIALGVLAACLAALLGALALLRKPAPALQLFASGYAGALSPPGVSPVDFALRDETGALQTLGQYRGRVVVFAFMYSHCPDFCPLQANQIRAAMDRLGHDVPVLALSMDPAGDTPQSVRSFEAHQGMLGRMHFLLGTRSQLAPLWATYGVQPQTAASNHSDQVLVLDRGGRQRVAFPPDELTPEGLAHDIRRVEGIGSAR
jgi:protein SCO1